jgi:hypothetical protein
MQPHLIDYLEKKFGGEVSKMQSNTTPRTPQFKIMIPTNKLEVIEAYLKSRFRSDMGVLLYLIKHSRPGIKIVLRELAKCMLSGL